MADDREYVEFFESNVRKRMLNSFVDGHKLASSFSEEELYNILLAADRAIKGAQIRKAGFSDISSISDHARNRISRAQKFISEFSHANQSWKIWSLKTKYNFVNQLSKISNYSYKKTDGSQLVPSNSEAEDKSSTDEQQHSKKQKKTHSPDSNNNNNTTNMPNKEDYLSLTIEYHRKLRDVGSSITREQERALSKWYMQRLQSLADRDRENGMEHSFAMLTVKYLKDMEREEQRIKEEMERQESRCLIQVSFHADNTVEPVRLSMEFTSSFGDVLDKTVEILAKRGVICNRNQMISYVRSEGGVESELVEDEKISDMLSPEEVNKIVVRIINRPKN